MEPRKLSRLRPLKRGLGRLCFSPFCFSEKMREEDDPGASQFEWTAWKIAGCVCAALFHLIFESDWGFSMLFKRLKEELDLIMDRDPAARSRAEVYFLYSGFRAVRSHRKANWFYRHNMKFIARWISQRARHKTGIEIHPAAKIGKGLFIDHGMGVVIGETAEIGDNCTIYQNVTLGGTGKETGKRHPTLGNNVMVGSGAKVLGPFRVGDNARIAAGAVVLSEVPANATAVGVPAHIVKVNGIRCEGLDQIHMGDPVSQEMCRMEYKIEKLEQKIKELEAELEEKENETV